MVEHVDHDEALLKLSADQKVNVVRKKRSVIVVHRSPRVHSADRTQGEIFGLDVPQSEIHNIRTFWPHNIRYF